MNFTLKDRKLFGKITVVVFAAALIHVIFGQLQDRLFAALDPIPKYFWGELFFLAVVVIAAVYAKKLHTLKPKRKGFGRGLFIGLWFAIYGLFGLLVAFSFTDGDFPVTVPGSYRLMLVLMSLMVGITEELLFRGILLDGYLDAYGEETPASIRTAVIVAGAIFGSIHLFNVLRGAAFTSALVQSVVNIPAGILLGAVYVRSRKNLWPGICLHAFMDYCGFVSIGALSGADLIGSGSYSPIQLSVGVIELVIALVALRTGALRKLTVESNTAEAK